MLRLVAILLILANAGYFVWTQGWLAGVGLAPQSPAEPERLARQVHPEALRLLSDEGSASPVAAVSSVPVPPSAPTGGAQQTCLQSPVLDEAAQAVLREPLAALPAAAWRWEPVTVEPERWMVYMGRYNDRATLDRKKDELKRKNVGFDPVTTPAFQPGLSLGRYSTEANARAALAQLETRGVTTAKVVQERAEARGQVLRFPAADGALQARLDRVRAALGVSKPLGPC